MSDLYKFENLVFNNYKHGGSRVYLENKNGQRNLICDTYADKDNYDDMRIKELIHKAIRDYFKELNK